MVLDFVIGIAPGAVAESIARFSILHHFDAAQRGVVEFRSVFYFGSLIALCLSFTALAVDARRAGVGLREILDDEDLLAEALKTTEAGLLSGMGVGAAALRAVGERLLVDAIGPLEGS